MEKEEENDDDSGEESEEDEDAEQENSEKDEEIEEEPENIIPEENNFFIEDFFKVKKISPKLENILPGGDGKNLEQVLGVEEKPEEKKENLRYGVSVNGEKKPEDNYDISANRNEFAFENTLHDGMRKFKQNDEKEKKEYEFRVDRIDEKDDFSGEKERQKYKLR